MTDFATLVLAADTRQMVGAEKAIDRVTAAGAKAEKGMDRLEKETREASVATKGLASSGSTAANVLRRLGAAAAAAFGTQAILGAAESYTKMDNSLRALGLSASEAQSRLGEVAGIATRTRAPLESTLQLYSRLSLAAGDLGASSAQLSRFTETVGMSLSAAGIGANEASGALLQLSQALSGGIVRAEEFNSIVEGAFPLARLAAQGIDEAGGSVSRLRNLVLDGRISSQEFFAAILAGSDQAKEAFGATSVTIGQALTALNNSFTLLVGGVDRAVGATSAIANAIVFVADNLGRIASIAVATGLAFAGQYVVGAIAAARATITFSTALTTLRAALIRTGIGALVVGAGELIYQFSQLVQRVGGLGTAFSLLGELAGNVWSGMIKSASAIPPALNGVWEGMKGGFFMALSQMATKFHDFVWIIANGLQDVPGMGDISASLFRVVDAASEASSVLYRAGDAANDAAKGSFETAAKTIDDAFSDARDTLDKMKTTVDENVVSGGKLETAFNAAAGGAENAKKKVKDLNKETEKAPQTVDDLANAWGDFVAGGFKDFKGFIQAIGNSFKNMIARMAADWARSGLMKMLGIGGAGVGVGGLIGSGGGSGLISGLGGVLSGGGLDSSFANLGGLLSGSVGGWGAIGAALPAAGIIFGAVMSLGQARANKFKQSMQAALDKVQAEAQRKTELMTQRLQANAAAIDDLNASLETLAQLESEREAAARAILGERQNLEVELLRLQNDLVALREREIEAMEPVNRQLARFVYAMRDAGQAIEEQRRALEQLSGAGQSIVQFVRGIQGAPGSSFAEDLALAQLGDLTATQRLPSSAQDAINQFKATARTGVEVDRFIAQTAASLLALPAVASYEEQQLALLDEISDGITDLTALQASAQRELKSAIEDGFFVIDENLDGKLTFDELKTALGGIATDNELRQIFDLLDVNGSNTLDKLEAVEGATALQVNAQRALKNAIEDGFFVIDENLDGKLTFDELKTALGGIATDNELRQIFDLLDVNGSNTLDKLEAVEGATALQVNAQRALKNAIEAGFFMLDENLDGKLTFDELKAALGGIATDNELRQIFDLLDVNGSGTLDKLEAVEGSTANTDANTLENWLAAQSQISELKLIAGESANNTVRVGQLTDAIENLIFGQKLASAEQLQSLQEQRTAAQAALESAQEQLAGTQSYIEGPRLYGLFGPRTVSPNPTYVALEADIRRLKEEIAALDVQIGRVPQFADGGMHMGGVRLVGESGPELEVTGPSRIYNSGDTMAMLSNAPVVSELRELRREVAALRDEQRQLGIQTSRNTDRTYRVLREWDVVGLPSERV